jgi:hypothetical protein
LLFRLCGAGAGAGAGLVGPDLGVMF